jgi:hypothetical protein
MQWRTHVNRGGNPEPDIFTWAIEVISQRATGQDRAAVVPVSDGLVIALADGAGGTGNGAVAAQTVIDAASHAASGSRPWSLPLEELDRDGHRLGYGQTTAVVLYVT